jgi:Protein of unknown function (DUF3592)
MKYATWWFVLAIAITAGIGSINLPTYRRLVVHGALGQATVLEVLPHDHNTLRYQYQVDGKRFRGQTQSWPPNPPLQQINLGQTVVIYYDPADPDVSVLGDPHGMLTNEIVSVGLAAIVLPTFLVIAWAGRQRISKAGRRS